VTVEPLFRFDIFVASKNVGSVARAQMGREPGQTSFVRGAVLRM
jgi:hypothetical protein